MVHACVSPVGLPGSQFADDFIVVDGQPPPDPATIAGEILASINLRAVDIGLAPKPGPTSASLIGLPVWMWVDDPSATTWGPESKSKTERGLTVTVTAAVDYVDWTMGDGTTVRCDQGTARPESDSVEPSPDCGHIYSTSSADQASGKFSITATSHWTVRWVAGALNGTLDPLELTSTAQLAIVESHAVLSRG